MEAKAYGRINEHGSAHRAMESAERAAGRIGEREEPPETSYTLPGLIDTQLAESLLSLSDLTAASAYAQQAAGLTTIRTDRPIVWSRSRSRASLWHGGRSIGRPRLRTRCPTAQRAWSR